MGTKVCSTDNRNQKNNQDIINHVSSNLIQIYKILGSETDDHEKFPKTQKYK